jgi:hypothetical protein
MFQFSSGGDEGWELVVQNNDAFTPINIYVEAACYS